MKPFRTKDGRVIVDQSCTCGHPFSQHGHRLANLPEVVVPVSHHEPCLEPGCTCLRFTFAGFVFGEQPREESS